MILKLMFCSQIDLEYGLKTKPIYQKFMFSNIIACENIYFFYLFPFYSIFLIFTIIMIMIGPLNWSFELDNHLEFSEIS